MHFFIKKIGCFPSLKEPGIDFFYLRVTGSGFLRDLINHWMYLLKFVEIIIIKKDQTWEIVVKVPG